LEKNNKERKMHNAKSAKGYISLGATLIAMASTAAANTNDADVQGITTADALGITTADVLGITTADAQGITTGDVLGITTADAQGITTADVLGITTADAQGITTADVLGITTADVLGITTADAQGITTADVLGITTADAQGITTADVLGITTADALGITTADSQVLAGPVDSIDIINGVFESMGQVVMASQTMLSGMRVGDYVTVSGSIASPGWLYADGVSVSTDSYVPGATEVFVTGLLSSVDLARGTAKIGSLTIDYTSSLGSASAPSGAIWSFKGIRPADRGVMLSDRAGDIY